MRSCLVVDDSAALRDLLKDHVRSAQKGIDAFYEAADASAALEVFRERKPDVVFLDIASDLGVLRRMLAERPQVPVVVVTGVAGAQPALVEAIDLGAAAALRKPVTSEDVKRVLDHLAPDAERMDYFG